MLEAFAIQRMNSAKALKMQKIADRITMRSNLASLEMNGNRVQPAFWAQIALDVPEVVVTHGAPDIFALEVDY